MSREGPDSERPDVVIIGAGFGGLEAAKVLGDKAVSVTLIDRNNHHLFQPLLYQVATAGLTPADIAIPIRFILKRWKNVRVLMGEALRVDLPRRRVVLVDQEIDYDYLIVATGATHAYFGNNEWAEAAPGLKTISEAIEIRRRILTAFETAERCANADNRQGILMFAVIGGGATGVELAGAIAELARTGLASNFRKIDPSQARILLLEGGPRLLPNMSEGLSRKAESSLRRLGVLGLSGMDHLVCDAHLLPDRIPQPSLRPDAVDVGLFDLPQLFPADHPPLDRLGPGPAGQAGAGVPRVPL